MRNSDTSKLKYEERRGRGEKKLEYTVRGRNLRDQAKKMERIKEGRKLVYNYCLSAIIHGI